MTLHQLLQVDPGREFMGSVTKEMVNHKAATRRGRSEIHRDEAIVKRFNHALGDLKRLTYRDAWISAFQLLRLPELFQITEVRASQRSVYHILIFSV